MTEYTLNNGMKISAIGFGCYNAKGGDNYQMFVDAIKNGYRFFDTASLYGTERDLGRAIKDSKIPREEFFVQSKVWLDEMGYEETKKALDRTLERLQMDYLDVYLIHWPRQNPVQAGAPGYPEIIPGKKEYDTRDDWKKLDLDTYKAMEEAVDEGKIKAIGLSNFLPHHIMNILDNCRIKPVVDQLEFHVGYTQPVAVSFCKENDIIVEAWSPLARGGVFDEPFFKAMADKYKVTTSQLALRFIYENGVIILPKSASPERQRENLDIFSFELSKEDFYILSCMVPTCWQKEHPDFVIPGKGSDFEQ